MKVDPVTKAEPQTGPYNYKVEMVLYIKAKSAERALFHAKTLARVISGRFPAFWLVIKDWK